MPDPSAPKNIDLTGTIDVTKLKSGELENLKSAVIKKLLKGQTLARSVVSNLNDISHNRHSSVHSKG